jgi:hypothetical protein
MQTTRKVKLRVTSHNVCVSPPDVTLPLGDYVGYLNEEILEVGSESRIVLAMIFLEDDARISSLGLTGTPRPIKFEVLRHIQSGAIQIAED